MGCNSSVNEDIQKDRKRLNSTNPNSPGPQKSSQIAAPASASHASSSKPVGIVSGSMPKNIGSVDDIYSRSQTDRRLEEADFLKSILERTQENFIDVSQKPAFLDEKDAEDRQTAYMQQLNVGTTTIPQLKNALPSLVSLPVPYFAGAVSSESAISVMATSSISQNEMSFIQASWHEIGSGLERVRVSNTATIAVTFEQFRIQ